MSYCVNINVAILWERPILWGGRGMDCRAINSSGDLLSSGHVYHHGLGKFFSIDSLIDPKDPDAATWFSANSDRSAWDMNDRLVFDFGQITGKIFFADNSQLTYLLTPVAKP